MVSYLLVVVALPTLPSSPPQVAIADSARMEISQGRFWHAAERLEAEFPGGEGCEPSVRVLFAEAEAGWENWAGVRALLEAPLEDGELNDGRAWYLLGRALEDVEEWPGAVAAYGRALHEENGESPVDRSETMARRARSECRHGRSAECIADVRALVEEDPALGAWMGLEAAEEAANEGESGLTLTLLSLVGPPEVRILGWSLPADALLASGDSAGAEAAYWTALPMVTFPEDEARAWERVGTLRLARGDSAGAQGAYHRVLIAASGGGASQRAAESLLGLGFDSVGVALSAAEVLRARGRLEEALKAYQEYEALLGLAEQAPSSQALLGKARTHLGLRQRSEALALARELAGGAEAAVGAPGLVLEAEALRGLGRPGEARAAEDQLVARFPQRPEATEVLFLRAVALEEGGDAEGALRGYAETAALAPAQNRAGEARMRMGQILLSEDRLEEALDVYSSYMSDFPDGRRWDEAAFWAGRTLLALDREGEAGGLLTSLRNRFPLTYYSVQAELLMGEPFSPNISEPLDPVLPPDFLVGEMAKIDALRAAGLERGASWEVAQLTRRLRGEGDPGRREEGLLRLALELNERGLTREGINLGWEVQREGRPWDRDLLRAIYPFPYRSIVEAEARERGLDPFFMAGLIRQESAFWAEARSRAGALGLMQVLPSTGAELARSIGPRPLRPDPQLYEPEISIHLGTAFFSDLIRRFGDNPSVLLSAYNAGPSRALRWRSFPELEDMPRFIERIPFTETRGYVKNVLLNRAIYTWLYGEADGGAAGPGARQGPA